MIVRAAISHEASQATTRSTRTPYTTHGEPFFGRRRVSPVRAPAVSGSVGRASPATSSSCDTGRSSRSGDLDLFAQAVPDVAVDLGELRRQPDLLDLAGTRQVDRDGFLDRPGAGGHDDDPVGQAD